MAIVTAGLLATFLTTAAFVTPPVPFLHTTTASIAAVITATLIAATLIAATLIAATLIAATLIATRQTPA